MKFGLGLLTDLANDKLSLEKALDTMLLPAMRKAGNNTIILQVVQREGTEKGSKRDGDYFVKSTYFKEVYEEWLKSKIDPMRLLLERKNSELEALAQEHKMLIDKYNKLVKAKK